jgi:signal transduction histidine kinase
VRFKEDAFMIEKPDCDALEKQVRELLANMARHSQARSGTVSISSADGKIIVEVKDDGVGFGTTRTGTVLDQSGGFGLFSIEERLGSFGGTIEVQSKPGEGTRATLIAPLKNLHRRDAKNADISY